MHIMQSLFSRQAPLHIEIGSGKGTFLLNQAKAHPEFNYLGIEWANKFYLYSVDRIRRWQVQDVRFLRTDARDFIKRYIADGCVDTLHVYFRELRLGAPTAVYGYGSTLHRGFFQVVSTPECQSHANMVTWEFPPREDLPPLVVHWYDGGMKPHRPHELDRRLRLPEPSGEYQYR